MSQGAATSSPAIAAPDTLRWLGVFLILTPLLTRATVSTTSLPGWDLDPTIFSLPTPALGPAGSMLVDALVLVGAAVLLFSERSARRTVHPLWLIGLAIGGAAVLLHGWFWQAIGSAAAHGSLGNQRIGLAWLAGLAAAVAVLHACRDAMLRRTIAGVFLAFTSLLFLRGLQQVFIEHPITMESFRANPDKWLTAHGWSADSPMAQAYIRRMRQPEATGWFGLSNVYASFAAFGFAVSAAWVIRARRLAPLITLLTSAGAIYLADSKGGYAVAAIALALVAIGAIVTRSTSSISALTRLIARAAPLLGPACIAGVLAAVVLRGLIGERISELSILFRWFYMQAAARIFAEHAATGVGPDGFQLAYLAAKNPLSPEEVSSPHSILLDWIATLGLAGIAWIFVLLAISTFIGRSLLSPPVLTLPAEADDTSTLNPAVARQALRTAMLSFAGATIMSAWIETPYIPPDTALVRLVGLLLGCFIVFNVVQSSPTRWLTTGLAAGSLAMLAHAQIELTGSAAASAGLFLVALAAAGSASVPSRAESESKSVIAIVAAAACSFTAAFALVRGVLPARAWESDLRDAAAMLQPIPEISDRRAALRSPVKPPTQQDVDRLSGDLSTLLGHPVTLTPQNELALMIELDRKLLPSAAQLLEAAQQRYPDEWRVGREASRLYLRLFAPLPAAQRKTAPPFPALAPAVAADYRAHAISAIPTCIEPANPDLARRNPSRTRALALVHETLAQATDEPEQGLTNAATLLAEAFKNDPYNLDIALRLFHLTKQLNRPEEARRWAAKVLELDELARLDRGVRGLSSQDRRAAEAAAAAPATAPSPPTPGRQPPG